MSKEKILECPHCGNKTVHEVLYESQGGEYVIEELARVGPDNTDELVRVPVAFDKYFFLVQCRTCKEPSLFERLEDPEFCPTQAYRLYPSEKHFSDGVPAKINKKYDEAKKIQNVSPRASVVLLRSALESLCHDKKAKGGKLHKRIEDLGNRGIIPPTLAAMAYSVKEFGDRGAHTDDEETTLEDARAAEDFFSALVEYVYVAPAKLDKISKRLKGITRSR